MLLNTFNTARPLPPEQNCLDIIEPFVERAQQADMPPFQALGGVGSVALGHELTVIKPEEKRIIAPADLYLSNFRDDGNLRDFEVLVMSADPEDIEKTQAMAEAMIAPDLLVEVFRLQSLEAIDPILAKPLGRKALMMFLSDRYLEDASTWSPDGPLAQRVLFPFAVPIPHEALETWTLQIGEDVELPVPAIGAVVLNYLTRSISGLRTKDKKKVEKMATAIFEKAPETLDWLIEGPGCSQLEMAQILHTLREPRNNPAVLKIGGKLSLQAVTGNLLEHPAFMLSDYESDIQAKALRIARVKSRTLHAGESIAPVVTLFQRYIEPRIKSILHNA